MTAAMIGIGNFFFKYRNKAFPVIVVALMLMAPPSSPLHGSTALEHAKDLAAVLLVFAGLALRATVIGYAYIQRGGLAKRVYAKDLVTEGMFGVCRNPLYVGNMLLYSGFFLFHGNPLVVALGIATFAFIYQCIVLAEEEFLEQKFGDAYRAYCRDVPRWGLRLSNFRRSTDGLVFNVRRIVVKDYSTVSAALITLLAIEFYRLARDGSLAQSLPHLSLLAALLATVGVATATLSLLKRRGAFRRPKPLR